MAKNNKNEIVKDILKWYNHKNYTRFGSDYSVSNLLQPARIIVLEDRYRDQLTVDEIEYILPALIGSATHDGIQHYLKIENMLTNKYDIERSLNKTVLGKRLAGRFDIYKTDEQKLLDIKVTSVWKYLNGGVDEWSRQLNIYKWMLRDDNIVVKTMELMMILVDWKPTEAFKHSNYPKSRVQFVNVPLDTNTNIKTFVENKIQELDDAFKLADDKLPLCSAADRWAKRTQYKLYRKSSFKRAYKIFEKRSSAQAYLAACQKNDVTKWKDAIIKKEQANLWKRCETWCKCTPFCNQYKNKIK